MTDKAFLSKDSSTTGRMHRFWYTTSLVKPYPGRRRWSKEGAQAGAVSRFGRSGFGSPKRIRSPPNVQKSTMMRKSTTATVFRRPWRCRYRITRFAWEWSSKIRSIRILAERPSYDAIRTSRFRFLSHKGWTASVGSRLGARRRTSGVFGKISECLWYAIRWTSLSNRGSEAIEMKRLRCDEKCHRTLTRTRCSRALWWSIIAASQEMAPRYAKERQESAHALGRKVGWRRKKASHEPMVNVRLSSIKTRLWGCKWTSGKTHPCLPKGGLPKVLT